MEAGNIKKSGYEWCLDANMRILDISSWDTDWCFYEEAYYEEKIDVQEFYRRIALCKVKANSTPRKTMMFLEYRMYGLVPYNLSPIQQGIQFGHAVVDYGRPADSLPPHSTESIRFQQNNPERFGSLNQHMNTLRENGVILQEFHEPDLGDQLTAFVFLVDERVFNRTIYPDFVGTPYPWPMNKKPTEKQFSQWETENNKNYAAWEEKIGGFKNAFLRDYLRNLKLA